MKDVRGSGKHLFKKDAQKKREAYLPMINKREAYLPVLMHLGAGRRAPTRAKYRKANNQPNVMKKQKKNEHPCTAAATDKSFTISIFNEPRTRFLYLFFYSPPPHLIQKHHTRRQLR